MEPGSSTNWSLGLDCGSVAIKLVIFDSGQIVATDYKFHYGDIFGCLQSVLSPWLNLKFKVAITGIGAKNFPEDLQVDEIVATLEGAKWALRQPFTSLLIIGGEKLRFIELDEAGLYRRHVTNSDCASGTGSFLEQQAARLGLSLPEFEELAFNYQGEIPIIATRCAVFARTDLIHRQQEGYSVASIAAGVSQGVARAIIDAVIKGKKIKSPLFVAGGGAIHRRLLSSLAQMLNLEVKPVPQGELVTALGAALLASEERSLQELLSLKKTVNLSQVPLNPPLKMEKSSLPDLSGVEVWEEEGIEINLFSRLEPASQAKVFLGLDIGSTSTKLVLMDENDSILLGLYTRTSAAPVIAVQRLFRWLEDFSQKKRISWDWQGVATTGSGRVLIGQLIGADLVINEITAHARAASQYLPDVDTVIEIGGQDSKFIRLQDGAVVQSLMNTICAAGTGSFLEEQAQKLGVSLSAYNDLVFGFSGPAISDRCTVYMERDLSRHLAEGWSKEELLASVLHSVRDNYLIRVVGQAKIGEKICFQGATARNRGLVAAFEMALNKKIYVPPYPHLAGAYGAALLVKELRIEKSKFGGLSFGQKPLDQKIEICEICPNRCRLTIVRVGHSLASWGFQCGREYEDKRKKRLTPASLQTAFPYLSSPIKKAVSKPAMTKKIGFPLILPLSETEFFWRYFFAHLGVELVLPKNEEDLLRRGQTLAKAEFCAPIYLAHGQVEKLARSGCDFIFFPIFLEGLDEETSPLPRFYCYYTAYLPLILQHSFEWGKEKLLSPVINFRWPDKKIIVSLEGCLAKRLGITKKEIAEAWKKSKLAWEEERQKRRDQGERLLSHLREGEWAILLLGRPYNLDNPLLNQNLPQVIESYGVKIFRAEMLDLKRDGESESNFLHWHYGQIIMQAAHRAAEDNRLFPIFVTNFRCSPDSFILTYFRDLMERAHKPYLILQLDGLNSDIGYRTRIEAALESFRHWKPKKKEKLPRLNFISLRKDKIWIIPHVDDTASALAVATLERFGYEALLAKENQKTIHRGLTLVGGGECLPTAALIGSLVDTIEKEKIPPARAALALPTSLYSCNFPQIPVLIKLMLERIGLEEVEIFTTALVNQREPIEVSLSLFQAYCLADNLRRLVARLRPYEKNRGEVEAYREQALVRLCRAIRDRLNLRQTFEEIIQGFASLPVEKDRSRPRVAVIGDLYVIANPEFNCQVEKEIEAAGGEVIPASLVDITHFSHLNRLSRAWKHRLWTEVIRTALLQLFLRPQDYRWRKMIIKGNGLCLKPLNFSSLKKVREKGLPPELDGETAINLAKIEHYLKEIQPDAFLHLNPIYCCPGVVTVPLVEWLEEKMKIPVINLYYDGLHNPNSLIKPYLYFLNKNLKG